jgi:hypothetical protein
MWNVEFVIREEWATSVNRVGYRLTALALGIEMPLGDIYDTREQALQAFVDAIAAASALREEGE